MGEVYLFLCSLSDLGVWGLVSDYVCKASEKVLNQKDVIKLRASWIRIRRKTEADTFIRERGGGFGSRNTEKTQGHVEVEAEIEMMHCTYKPEIVRSPSNEVEGQILPQILQWEYHLSNALVFTSSLHNSERIPFCCFKPPILCLVFMALEN